MGIQLPAWPGAWVFWKDINWNYSAENLSGLSRTFSTKEALPGWKGCGESVIWDKYVKRMG
jgi:hypothetical protein